MIQEEGKAGEGVSNIAKGGEQASSPILAGGPKPSSMMAPNSNSSQQRMHTSKSGVPQGPFPDSTLPSHMVAGNRRTKRKTGGDGDSTMTASATPRRNRMNPVTGDNGIGLPDLAASSPSFEQRGGA